jgi:hypothetical protein
LEVGAWSLGFRAIHVDKSIYMRLPSATSSISGGSTPSPRDCASCQSNPFQRRCWGGASPPRWGGRSSARSAGRWGTRSNGRSSAPWDRRSTPRSTPLSGGRWGTRSSPRSSPDSTPRSSGVSTPRWGGRSSGRSSGAWGRACGPAFVLRISSSAVTAGGCSTSISRRVPAGLLPDFWADCPQLLGGFRAPLRHKILLTNDRPELS